MKGKHLRGTYCVKCKSKKLYPCHFICILIQLEAQHCAGMVMNLLRKNKTLVTVCPHHDDKTGGIYTE